MITITENKTHIMQMKDDFKIKEVQKSEIIDFGTIVTGGDLRIVFTVKVADNVNGSVVMHFCNHKQFDEAISEVIEITDKIGI